MWYLCCFLWNNVNETKFVGPVGLNRVARFDIDPHDNRTAEDFYELIGDDDGVFGLYVFNGM